MGQRIFSLCGNGHVYLKPLHPVLVLLHPSYLVLRLDNCPTCIRSTVLLLVQLSLSDTLSLRLLVETSTDRTWEKGKKHPH